MKRPFFLFPGLSCNERLFEAQKFGLDNLVTVIVPRWIRPTNQDQIDSFSLRWAQHVWEEYYSENVLPEKRLDPSLGCYVGGHCFGGIVALIVGQYLEEKGVKVHRCFRFTSADHRQDFSNKWLFLGRVMNILPDGAWLAVNIFCSFSLYFFASARYDQVHAREKMYRQVIESPARRNFHVVRMIYSWKKKLNTVCNFPIIMVRGTKDSVIPFNKLKVNSNFIVLPHAGHGMMVTHSAKVNDLIRKFI